MEAVTARYDGTKNNRGNTSGNHRSASTEESAAILLMVLGSIAIVE